MRCRPAPVTAIAALKIAVNSIEIETTRRRSMRSPSKPPVITPIAPPLSSAKSVNDCKNALTCTTRSTKIGVNVTAARKVVERSATTIDMIENPRQSFRPGRSRLA
jgi:hypothetical protein